jgi:hypothetical protein
MVDCAQMQTPTSQSGRSHITLSQEIMASLGRPSPAAALAAGQFCSSRAAAAQALGLHQRAVSSLFIHEGTSRARGCRAMKMHQVMPVLGSCLPKE